MGDPTLMQWASAVLGAAAAKAAGGNAKTGASVAASQTKNNYLSHEQQQQKLKELENAKEEDKAAIRTKWDELSDKQKGYLILINI
ncbi:MAG: filamentous hemagglutinin family outer membrane protein [Firmicutes bacterium]|nr:filamentous hemagglutinin family outer membrane protein [Bacillota bacterium]